MDARHDRNFAGSGLIDTLALVALLIFSTVAGAQTGAGTTRVGFVTEITGQAAIQGRDGRVIPAAPGSTLENGAMVSTEGSSELVIKFADGEVIKLAPATRIVIRRYQFSPQNIGNSVSEITIFAGAIRVVSGAIGQANPTGLRIAGGGSAAALYVSGLLGAVAVGATLVAEGEYGVFVNNQVVRCQPGGADFVVALDSVGALTPRSPAPLIAAPSGVQATVAALAGSALPNTNVVAVEPAATAAAAVAAAKQAQAAAAANPGSSELQKAAQAAEQRANIAIQIADAQSAALNATVNAAIISALPPTAAGPSIDLSSLFNATPPVTGCVGSPC